jgi:branched-chain amino acid transport system substrate-binding protein
MKRAIARPVLGAAAAATLLLAACSSKGGSTDGSTSSPASSIEPAIGSQFSGGKPGAADKGATPIKVGMINQEGGQVSDPEGSVAVKAAFDYINASQGGVGGHPLQLELCKVTSSEEEAQQCAQKFLNDSSISVVIQGGLNVGANAVHQTLAGAKPDLVTQANPADTAAKNSFVVNPSIFAGLPGAASYAKSKGYKSVSIIVSDNPGDIAISQVAQNTFKGAGIASKVTTFPAGSTDVTSAFTAALAAKTDAIVPIVVTISGCIAGAKAFQSLGSDRPVLGTNYCVTDDVKKGLGDFPKWAYESTILSLFAPDDTGQLAFYKAVMARYAGSNAQLGINAPYAFGTAFLLAKVLNQVGPTKITPSAVTSALKSYTDGVLLYAPKVAYGSVPGMPALSGLADRYYLYAGNGKWTATDWQNLAK